MAEDKKIEAPNVNADVPQEVVDKQPVGYEDEVARQQEQNKIDAERAKELAVEVLPVSVVVSPPNHPGPVLPTASPDGSPSSAAVVFNPNDSDAVRKAKEIALNDAAGAIPAVVDAKLAEEAAKNDDPNATQADKDKAQEKAVQENA